MANRPIAEYPCTQLELYAVLRIGLSNFREHIPQFGNFKARYDAAWGNTFEAEINAAAALPDFQARDEKSESAGIKLEEKARDCGDKWQDLKRYIASVEDWKNLQKPKLEAAGSTLYQQATHGNWEVMKGLMETAKNFITNNLAELQANQNMPAAFPGQLDTLKQDYEALYDDFTGKTQAQEEETDEKINENNRLHGKLMEMFLDGQAIFRKNAALKQRFVFQSVLKIVRGSKGKTKLVTIPPTGRQSVSRVVKNSKVTNTGQTTLWVDQGNQQSQTPAAIELSTETSIPVPGNSKELTIFNNNTQNAGQCTIRVTVD